MKKQSVRMMMRTIAKLQLELRNQATATNKNYNEKVAAEHELKELKKEHKELLEAQNQFLINLVNHLTSKPVKRSTKRDGIEESYEGFEKANHTNEHLIHNVRGY